MARLINTIISAEGSAIFETLIKSGNVDQLVDQHQIAGLKAGLEIPAKDYLKAMRIRALLQEAFRDLLSTTDVLIAPTRFDPAPKITQPLDRRANDRPTPVFGALIPAGNLAGLPALSIPCGFANGMPMGLQLVGSPFSENMLLAIGKTFQDRTIGTSAAHPCLSAAPPARLTDWSRFGSNTNRFAAVRASGCLRTKRKGVNVFIDRSSLWPNLSRCIFFGGRGSDPCDKMVLEAGHFGLQLLLPRDVIMRMKQ